MSAEQDLVVGEDFRITLDPALTGRRVQADGGSETPGTHHGSREAFEGTLTGRRLLQGDPPWIWLEIGDLTEKPLEFEEDHVWCDAEYVYFQE